MLTAPGGRRTPPPSLTARSDFLRVQGEGRRFRRERLTVLVHGGERNDTRVGYTVSRKVGNAVIRNRVRRRLREIVRLHQELLVTGFDYVIVGSPAAAASTYEALEHELRALLGAVRAWADDRRARPEPPEA